MRGLHVIPNNLWNLLKLLMYICSKQKEIFNENDSDGCDYDVGDIDGT